MPNTRRDLLLNALKLFDLALMIGAFLLGALVVLHQTRNVGAVEFFAMRVKIQNFIIFSILILVWHVTVRAAGLYVSRRLSSRRGEALDIVKATSLGFAAIAIIAIGFRIRLVTPVFLCAFWLGTTCCLVLSRLTLRAMLSIVRKRGRNLRHVVIVGTNCRALALARHIAASPELGYKVAGFVDEDWQGANEVRRDGYAVVSNIDNFNTYLRTSIVDEVVMALPFRSMHNQASWVASACGEQGVTLRVLPGIFDLKTSHSPDDGPEADLLFTPHSTAWEDGWPLIMKRIVDLTVSLTSLIVLSPLLALVAILIKFCSPGPVLFIQKRIGLNKRPFRLIKFRTMVLDAEKRMREIQHLNEASGPVFKMKNDPRIHPVGRFLRKTSLDELPQLFHVLMGDMSLVGPRPLPVRDYEGFSEDWQRRRFSVKPGITCLWQVRGRSSISFDKWMELDLLYIDKWSLWLDLKILLQTIPAVLKGSGAA
jgi:exopolysaccharide biosynthesis polyprenyl glycosylphosphotransferase